MHGDWVEAVLHGALYVVEGIGAASGIECVAVREEGARTLFAEHLAEAVGEVGAYVSQVAGFAEMEFDGHKLLFKREFKQSGAYAKTLQFVQQVAVCIGPEVSEKHFRSHSYEFICVKRFL